MTVRWKHNYGVVVVLLCIVSIPIINAGCCSNNSELQAKFQPGDQKVAWAQKEFHNKPENFQFAIVADRTSGFRPGVFESAVEKINLLQPEFVMSVGDFIEGYTADVAELEHDWDEFESIIDALEMPFFYVPGNHDFCGIDAMKQQWAKRFGPSYYHFVYGDVLFLCLNTEDPPVICAHPDNCFSDEQMAYFQSAIEANKDVRWTIIFMHNPVGWVDDLDNWKKLETMLGDMPYTVFAGHIHSYKKTIRNDRSHYILSVTGGQGHGPAEVDRDPPYKYGKTRSMVREKGNYDHIVWVTMTDNGPVVANLLLEGILDDNAIPTTVPVTYE